MYTRAHFIVDTKSRALLPASVISELMIIMVMCSTWMHLYSCNLTMAHSGGFALYVDAFVQLYPYYDHTGLYSSDFGFCWTGATLSLYFNLFCNSNDCDIVSDKKKRTW